MKINNVYIISILYFLCNSYLFAQDISIKYSANGNNSFVINMASFDSISNCYYLAVSGNAPNTFRTGLIKLDKCGNLIWFKKYNNMQGTGSYCSIIHSNLIAITTIYESFQPNDKSSCILVDSSGNIINQLTTKDINKSLSYLYKGSSVNFLTLGDLSVYGLDNSGNVIWSKSLIGQTPASSSTVTHARTINHIGNLLLIISGNNQTFIIEVDNSGNIIRQRQFSFNCHMYHFQAYSDGVYILYNPSTLFNFGHRVLKLDNNLNLKWNKEIYATNGIDRNPPLYGPTFNFPYSMSFNDGVFYAEFACSLTGRQEYNLIGLDNNDGHVVSHHYLPKSLYYTPYRDIAYGLVLEDSATSFYRPIVLSGKEAIFNNCFVKVGNNVSVRDSAIIISSVNEFISVNETSGLDTYSSYSIENNNTVSVSFLCNRLFIGNDSSVCTFKNYFLTVRDSLQYSKIRWNTGDTSFSLQISRPGQYIASVFNSCGLSISDTVNIIQTFQTKKDTSFTFCTGDTLTYNNKKYYTQGTFFDTIRSSSCDTLQKIKIITRQSYNIRLPNIVVCEGEPYNNTPIFNDTVLLNYLFTTSGCDSIIEQNIKVNNKSTNSENIQVCKFSYFNSVQIMRDTMFVKKFLNANQCDSTVTYNINVVDTIRTFLDTNICSGSIFLNKLILNDTTIKVFTKAMNGCDSISVYNITASRLNESFLSITRCKGMNHILPSGRIVTQAGVYRDTIINQQGCDSIVITNLIFTDPVPNLQAISICNGQSYVLPNGNTVSTANTYIDTIKNENTCDSVIITNLSVFPNTFSVSLLGNDTIDNGDSIELLPSYENGVAISWNWMPSEFLSCSNCEHPFATPIQNTIYIVTARASNNCEDTAMKQIIVRSSDVYIPSAFSPNNDGINDELTVFVSSSIFYNLKVFNRWGEIVFESLSVQDKWDGLYKGHDAPVDSYLYIIDVVFPNGKQNHKQGTISLLR